MRKTSIMILIILLPFWGCRTLPESKDPATVTIDTEPSVIDENTNIHYTGLYCIECHETTPMEGGDTHLKYNGDYQQLCRCHHGMSPGYCHPLEVKLEQNPKRKIPDSFPTVDGAFTCNTCHDVYLQCRKRLFDRQSLRGAPYPLETDFCYECHDIEKYPHLNAHRQIQTDGTLNVEMCLYCHEEKPDEKTASYEEVTFIGDIKSLCRRCHPVEGNHSGNFDHMANPPSAEGLRRMEAMKEKYDIILPLAEDGKMTCITCHNPHEKGVIQEDKASAKGADSTYRHRLPGKMCEGCHEK